MKPVLIASDHAGYALKKDLIHFLTRKGISVKDIGAFSEESCDYPDFAGALAGDISTHRYARGILICKSGIGNSIVANRFPGVRAALCYTTRTAQLSREHNDSNVLVLGAGFVSRKQAQRILDVWLTTDFQGGRHARRLNKIKKIERQIRRLGK